MSPPLNSHMRKTSRTVWILFHIVTRQTATFWYFGRGYFSCYYYILSWRLALLAVWPSHAVLRAFLSPAADDLKRGFSGQRFSARLISEKILMISGPTEKCRLGVEGEGAIIKTPRVKGNPAVRFFIYTSRLKGAHLKCQKAIFTLLMKVNWVWCFASSLEADGTIIAAVSTRFMSVITLETCRLQLRLFLRVQTKYLLAGSESPDGHRGLHPCDSSITLLRFLLSHWPLPKQQQKRKEKERCTSNVAWDLTIFNEGWTIQWF